MNIIPATFNQVGGAFRFTGKDGSTEFSIIGFAVSDKGEVEKAITFPTIPKGAKIERHNGVSGWEAFSLEVQP